MNRALAHKMTAKQAASLAHTAARLDSLCMSIIGAPSRTTSEYDDMAENWYQRLRRCETKRAAFETIRPSVAAVLEVIDKMPTLAKAEGGAK